MNRFSKSVLGLGVVLMATLPASILSADRLGDQRTDSTASWEKGFKPHPVITPKSKFSTTSAGGLVIYCNVVGSDGDALPSGIYSFTPDFDITLTPVKLDDKINGNKGAVYIGDKYELVNFFDHYTYDTESWELLHECRLTFPANMEMAAQSVTYDPTTDKVYGCFLKTGSFTYRLATADYAAAAVTEICDFGNEEYPYCMFVDNSGILYGIMKSGDLVTIDKTTGETAIVGNVGIEPTTNQGAVCDPATGTTYMVAYNNGAPALYELDLTDASTVQIGEFPDGADCVGLFIKSSQTPPTPPTPPTPGDDTVTIYGNVPDAAADYPVGIYSFTPGFEIELSAVKNDDSRLSGNKGAVFTGDKYEVVNFFDHYTYDTESWETIHECRLTFPANMEMAAQSVAYDPETGNVYGCFLKTGTFTYRFATADYASNTVTEICDFGNEEYPTNMFSDNNGVLYGIMKSGNLVTIDKTSGQTAVIGNIGFEPSGYQGAVCTSDGKVYVTVGNALYELDTDDASTVLVGEFPEGVQFTGLYVKESGGVVETEAPAMAADLSLNYTEGSLAGTVSFNIPAVSDSGAALTGDVSYTVKFNDTEMTSGVSAPGSQVTVEITAETAGDYLVSVVLSNVAGESHPAYKRQYIGYDKPCPPSDVNAVLSDGTATVTWSAPESSLNGAWFDADNLKYKVVRYPDNKLVASEISALTCTDTFDSDELTSYTYGVTAFNGPTASEESVSNSVVYGTMVRLPYSEAFDTENSLDLYTIVDSNVDGQTWHMSYYNPVLEYYANQADNDGDDWVITPKFRLEASKIYSVEFTATGSSPLYSQNIEAFLGQDNNAGGMETCLVELTELTGESRLMRAVFTVEEDGLYCVGLHTSTAARHGWISVRDLRIEEAASKSGPAAVSDLTVTAGEKGEPTAKVEFTTPASTYDGSKLEAIISVEVRRDGETVKTWENPATGASLSFEDSGLDEGIHYYSVSAISTEGRGYPSDTEVYVGHDIPSPVYGITLEKSDGGIILKWEVSDKGLHGGYVDVDKLLYSIQRSDEEMVANGLAATTFEETPPTAEHQYDLAYAIVAISDKGMSSVSVSPYMLWGEDYTLPLHETFPDGTTSYYWGVANSGAGLFGLTNMVSLDGGAGGSAVYQGVSFGAESSITSGRISMVGSVYPLMEMYVGLNNGAVNMDIEVWSGDDERVKAASYELTKVGEIASIKVPLTAYAGKEGVRLAIRCQSNEESMLFVDNINIAEDPMGGIGNVSGENVAVTVSDGVVSVLGAAGLEVAVSSIAGIAVSRIPSASDVETFALSPGVYVISAGGRTFKVVVK